jgi:hypothetical protein
MIDTSKFADNAVYSRIRRGFYHNCEPALFELDGKFRVGLFAIAPSILPMMLDRKPRKGDPVVIGAGDELVLPFDVAPVIPIYRGEWRAQRSRKPDIDLEMFRQFTQNTQIRIKPQAEAPEGETAETAVKPPVPVKSDKTGSTLAGLFGGDGELFVTLTGEDPNEEERRVVYELPQVFSRLNLPGRPPFLQHRTAREPEPAPAFRFQPKGLVVPADPGIAVLKELLALRPQETWEVDEDDIIGPIDADLRVRRK